MNKDLAQIAEIMVGHTYRAKVNHDYQGDTFLLQAKEINEEGGVNTEHLPKVLLGTTRSKAYLIPGDVLISSRGVFRAGVWNSTQENVLATSTVYVLRITRDSIIPEYLALFLNSNHGQRQIAQKTRGATIKSLPKSSLLDVSIPIISLEKQKMAINIYKTGIRWKCLENKKIQQFEKIYLQTIDKIITTS